jgi:hypothetical protein
MNIYIYKDHEKKVSGICKNMKFEASTGKSREYTGINSHRLSLPEKNSNDSATKRND